MVTAMTMEWSKSGLSAAELERKRREYIEAAMRMSRRSAEGVTAEAAPIREAFEPIEERAAQTADPEPRFAPEPPEEEPEIIAAPELLHEPEPLAETAPKEKEETSFGVFDVEELIEAVKNGEVDGEKLREATEILEEMSGKTAEMQRLAEHPRAAEDGGEPKSLSRSVRQHNSGSCSHCGQGNRNGPRR